MVFKESTHEYFSTDSGTQYGGVTSFISKFIKKQDWAKIAQNYVKKRTSDQILKDLAKKWDISLKQAEKKWGGQVMDGPWLQAVWKENSSYSLLGGNTYHNAKEIEDSETLENVIYNPVVDDSKLFIELDTLQKGYTYLELGVYSHRYELCGQADKVIIDDNKMSIIRDYKTNQKPIVPEGTAFYSKEVNRKIIKRMLPPVSHLIDNDYWKYALQLSMYAYLLELYGIKNKELWIDHVITKNIKLSSVTKKHQVLSVQEEFNRARVYVETKPIKMPYLRKEIISLLNHRAATL